VTEASPTPSSLQQGADRLALSTRKLGDVLRWLYQLPEAEQETLRERFGSWVRGRRG
jgi:hypothetical protein